MTHALSADGCLGDFHAASVADHALIADLLILTTMTLPVLLGSKNLLTEQAVSFRLQGSVVDGFGLCHFAVRPLADLLRRCQANLDRVERHGLIIILVQFWH